MGNETKMKIQTLSLKVNVGEDGINNCDVDINGDKTTIAQAICGLMQVDERFQATIMESVINFLAKRHMTIQEYVVNNLDD